MADDGPKWEGGSDAEYRKYKKARADWNRMIRDAASDPVRNEEEAIERAKQSGDREFEQGIEDLIGYSLKDVQEVYGSLTKDEIQSMTAREREAFEALQRANRTIFFKASAQRDAQRKFKKAKGEVQKRVKRKKSWFDCAVIALAIGLVTALEIAMIVSGVVEAVQAVTP